MKIEALQKEIIRLKKETDTCILAHAYQNHEILEVADFVGDSYGLSIQARSVSNKNILMSGVRFMAETVKLLSPEKRVILANEAAGCPMAEQVEPELLETAKRKYPEYTFVCYINTTAELKALCNVCVTSSVAKEVVEKIENNKIFFLPDAQLGAWIRDQIPNKDFLMWHGGCSTHLRIRKEDMERARNLHPSAEILVHPECAPEIVKKADFVGSTTAIMDYARKSSTKQFVIGTENSIVNHLQLDCPDKLFFPLSRECVCHNMRVTTLGDIFHALKGEGGEEIVISKEIALSATDCIKEMIRLQEK